MAQELKVNLWDWVVTKDGEIVQIDSDDMHGLPYEKIDRLANEEEIKKGIIKRVRCFADTHAGVTEARKTLDKYDPLPTINPTFSQYTVLKAMEDYANIMCIKQRINCSENNLIKQFLELEFNGEHLPYIKQYILNTPLSTEKN